jgi:hypothetical protein
METSLEASVTAYLASSDGNPSLIAFCKHVEVRILLFKK